MLSRRTNADADAVQGSKAETPAPIAQAPAWLLELLRGPTTTPKCLESPVTAPSDAGAAGEMLVNGYMIEANADLTKANLAAADLTAADLRDANLTNANLTNANLFRAKLTAAALTAAALTNADLRSANLYRANLTAADLTAADLTNADLRDAEWNAGTIWPEGFDPPPTVEKPAGFS